MNASAYKSVAAALALVMTGCGGSGDNIIPADAVAIVGGDVLTRRDVASKVPAGVAAEDSAALASAYVRSWINMRLIEQVASKEVDMQQIDRLTAEYRSELIMSQYRRAMAQQADGTFSDDSLRSYFDSHQEDFRLERPLIKGVYLKVPEDAQNLAIIRRLYKSERPVDIDKLEKAALGNAIHYDYFRDSWVDWEQVENRIPLDFSGENFDKISKRQNVDFTADGFVYLLSVSDYLPAGNVMPYEAAMPLVRERLLAVRRRAYDSRLLNDLYNRAVEDGTVTFPAAAK